MGPEYEWWCHSSVELLRIMGMMLMADKVAKRDIGRSQMRV